MASKLYHTKDNGEVGICRAGAHGRGCPFVGRGQHFNTLDEALAFSEEILSSKMNGSFGNAIHKRIAPKAPRKLTEDQKNELVKNLYNRLPRIGRMTKPETLSEVLHQASLCRNPTVRREALVRISNNPHITPEMLVELASYTEEDGKSLAKRTENIFLRDMMAVSDYDNVRKAAVTARNDSTPEGIYALTLMYPKNYYSKRVKNIIKNNGLKDDLSFISEEEKGEKIQTMIGLLKMRAERLIPIQNKGKTLLDKNALGNQRQYIWLNTLNNNVSHNKKVNERLSTFIAMNVYYSDRVTKARENVTQRKISSGVYYNSGESSSQSDLGFTGKNLKKKPYIVVEKDQQMADIWNNRNKPEPTLTTSNEHFSSKQIVPKATYEDSLKLQSRWNNGFKELPVEMQKNVINSKIRNVDEGINSIYKLFTTNDASTYSPQNNGLENFADHIMHMKQHEDSKGYISEVMPEFVTPIGIFKVEKIEGNDDYGKTITFKVNGEKFRMHKPMNNEKWTNFVHIIPQYSSDDYDYSGGNTQVKTKEGIFKRIINWFVEN